MREFKGTPGPWQHLGDPDDECRVRQTASVRHGDGYCSEITICESISSKDNARLIAAAPELLAALQKLHASLKSLNDCGDAGRMVEEDVETARAAIALVLE